MSPRPISTWCMPCCAGNARHGFFVMLSWWCMRDRQILDGNLNTSGNRQRQAQTALWHPDNEQGFVTTTSVQHKCQQRNTPSNPSETLVSWGGGKVGKTAGGGRDRHGGGKEGGEGSKSLGGRWGRCRECRRENGEGKKKRKRRYRCKQHITLTAQTGKTTLSRTLSRKPTNQWWCNSIHIKLTIKKVNFRKHTTGEQ